ncbi:MAG: membrane protein insertion efficiency factor YidD [Candidatus Thiodiazotropha sp.]
MGRWHPVVIAISGYQRYISPHKGFCCAHRKMTGEMSCSEFVKQESIHNGLGSWRTIFQRFELCKESARYLSEHKAGEQASGNRKKSDKGSTSDALCCATVARSCVPSGGADISIGSVADSAGNAVSGGCDACACTPF